MKIKPADVTNNITKDNEEIWEIPPHYTQERKRKPVYSNGVNLYWGMDCGRESVNGIQLQCKPATRSIAFIVQPNTVTRVAQWMRQDATKAGMLIVLQFVEGFVTSYFRILLNFYKISS